MSVDADKRAKLRASKILRIA